MKKIYEAIGKEKSDIIDANNDYKAYQRQFYQSNSIGESDMIMVGRTRTFPFNSCVNTHWSLNGLIEDKDFDLGEFIIIEPIEEQTSYGKLLNLNEINTYFKEPIELSDRAVILMPLERYNELSQFPELKSRMDKMDVRLYEGDEELAVRMLFFDKNYIYLRVTKDGYYFDEQNHPDTIEYTKILLERQKKLSETLRKNISGINYKGKKHKYIAQTPNKGLLELNEEASNYKMITGLTEQVEGEIKLDDELYGATDIGKVRANQEDAILLIKDEEIPDFKMIVVADGMGGLEKGEVASDVIVNKLKDWFENLSKEEKECYYKGVSGLKESLQRKIETDIQVEVEHKTSYLGGSTLVCAIIGKNDTLISNIGDSRAYMIKSGQIVQLSREDTLAQKKLEMGKTPTKEAARFDEQANELIQCVGMDRKELSAPYFQILSNNDYDMLALFSDGVTDCLSDDDIMAICNSSDRKEIAKTIVEKAIEHDSIQPKEYEEYDHLTPYIPGGKDNTTVAIYVPIGK